MAGSVEAKVEHRVAAVRADELWKRRLLRFALVMAYGLLALSWGVETFLVPSVEHTDDMVAQVDFSLLSIGRLKVGDRVVVVAGSPPNTVGSTNLIRVHEVGTDS